MARQEAARRKDIKDAKKVITTKDMPESARRPAAAAPAAADASAPQGGQPAGGQQQPPAGAAGNAAASEENGEAAWRGRITQARESLKRNEVLLDAVLMRVNGLTADYDRNSPFERATIGETRQKALEEAGRLKADIERTKKQIDDIEEAARKAGVPPGWLR